MISTLNAFRRPHLFLFSEAQDRRQAGLSNSSLDNKSGLFRQFVTDNRSFTMHLISLPGILFLTTSDTKIKQRSTSVDDTRNASAHAHPATTDPDQISSAALLSICRPSPPSEITPTEQRVKTVTGAFEMLRLTMLLFSKNKRFTRPDAEQGTEFRRNCSSNFGRFCGIRCNSPPTYRTRRISAV